MFQVRIHGRGGQGVVTAAELLSMAAFREGRHAQAFPSFGSERNGAPVVAFCRVDDKAIRLREPVGSPDALIIQDPTLLHQVEVFSGLSPEGFVLINTSRSPGELGLDDFVRDHLAVRLYTVPATEMAMRHFGRPMPNAALLGGFAAATGRISIESVAEAIGEKFNAKVAGHNIDAAREAYDYVLAEKRETERA